MDRRLLLDDTTLRILGAGLGVLADEIYALNNSPLFLNEHLKNLTGLTLIFACIDENGVVLFNM